MSRKYFTSGVAYWQTETLNELLDEDLKKKAVKNIAVINGATEILFEQPKISVIDVSLQ